MSASDWDRMKAVRDAVDLLDSSDKKREYGLPNSSNPGKPTWEPAPESAPNCPHCGGNLCLVKVEVEQELLKGGKGMSTYLGCPACPFASPAMVVSTGGNQK
jgi:hypothetical protein